MLAILQTLILQYVLSFLLSLGQRHTDKLSPYECGLEPIGDARSQLNIVYYMIGQQYQIFDLEIQFLYPFAASFWQQNTYIGFITQIQFFILLTLGFIYEYMSNVFSLDKM